MRKVLIICTVPTMNSGIPHVVFNLLNAIDKHNLEFGYVSINEPSDLFKRKLDNMKVRLYVIPRSLKKPWEYVKALSQIAQNYDIIHVHGNSATMILEMIAAKKANVSVRCAHAHSTTCSFPIIDKLSRPLFYRLCNTKIACGLKAGKWLYKNHNFTVINNGIDTDRFRFQQANRDKIKNAIGWENNFILANVANFLEVKNHKFLISTFAEVIKSHPEARLLLLGDGPLLNEAKQQAKNLGIDSFIHFAGSVTNVNEYLSAIDLIVMPSLYEGLPLTLVEEQANGLCAIVSDAITTDVNLTGNITFLPLSSGVTSWNNTISNFIEAGVIRNEDISNECISKIKKANFDIFDAAAKLKDLYMS